MKAIQDDEERENFRRRRSRRSRTASGPTVAERKAYVEASNVAIRATVEDHNAVMAKIRIDQEAAKAESEGK